MKSVLRLSLVQSNLHWQNAAANREMFQQKIDAISSRPHIIVLPEMFTSGFTMEPQEVAEEPLGETFLWMKNIAAQKKAVVTGSFVVKENGAFYNRLIWMLPNGEYGTYNKRHLFGFAGEDKHYTAGKNRLIASVNGWKIQLQICYDLRFPVWARQSPGISPEYDVLINVANWPEKRIDAWQTLLKARAIENQSFVIGVNRVGTDPNNNNYNGSSMVVDALGNVIVLAKDAEELIEVELQSDNLTSVRSRFPFLRDADDFQIGN